MQVVLHTIYILYYPRSNMHIYHIPSGKRLRGYRKSPLYSWVNQRTKWSIFNSYVCLPEGSLQTLDGKWVITCFFSTHDRPVKGYISQLLTSQRSRSIKVPLFSPIDKAQETPLKTVVYSVGRLRIGLKSRLSPWRHLEGTSVDPILSPLPLAPALPQEWPSTFNVRLLDVKKQVHRATLPTWVATKRPYRHLQVNQPKLDVSRNIFRF